jgi:T5orf172 domain-containing protein
MSPFTDEERAFLSRHGFSEEEVHDGRYEGKRTREFRAKQIGKILILTSTPCRAMRHRIRTRAGHCAQCKPANIGFTARETSSGYVYIAGSLRGRLMKIGVAGDIAQRERQLRAESYGGFADWVVLVNVWVDDSGKVERQISSSIKGQRFYNSYWKDGVEQVATEMIRCSFRTALIAFTSVVGRLVNEQRILSRCSDYEFDP